MTEFLKNGVWVYAVRRDPYRFQDGTISGWAILFLPSRDRFGHQDGDRREFATEAARDAALEKLEKNP